MVAENKTANGTEKQFLISSLVVLATTAVVLVGLLSNPPLHGILAAHDVFSRATEGVAEGKEQPRQIQHRLTGTEVDKLVHAYERGESVRRLVVRFGVCRTTVLAHLKRRDVPGRANHRKLAEWGVERAAALYAAGDSLSTVARVLEVDPSTVAKELRRAGVSIRPRPGCGDAERTSTAH